MSDDANTAMKQIEQTVLGAVRAAIDTVPEENQPMVAGLLWRVLADPEIADLLLKTELPPIEGLEAWLRDKAY